MGLGVGCVNVLGVSSGELMATGRSFVYEGALAATSTTAGMSAAGGSATASNDLGAAAGGVGSGSTSTGLFASYTGSSGFGQSMFGSAGGSSAAGTSGSTGGGGANNAEVGVLKDTAFNVAGSVDASGSGGFSALCSPDATMPTGGSGSENGSLNVMQSAVGYLTVSSPVQDTPRRAPQPQVPPTTLAAARAMDAPCLGRLVPPDLESRPEAL